MQRSLSVVIPTFNEEGSIEKLYRAICDSAGMLITEGILTSFDIWFIDDGSTDNTLALFRKICRSDPRCHVIVFRHNFGKAAALAAGFEHAQGDIIITMDADFQDDPCDFKRFIEELDKGCDLVSGWKKVRNDPLEKRLPSKLFNKITAWLSGVNLHDFNCGFKAYRKETVKSLDVYGEFHRYLPVLAARNGFLAGEIPVVNHKREFGHSKYGWERYLRGFFDSISVVFLLRYSDRPMYLFGKLALFSLLLSFVLLILGFTAGMSVLSWIGAMFSVVLSVIFFLTGLVMNLILDTTWRLKHRADSIKEIIGR